MSTAQSEPSMDDILASIRRIISEEDEAAPAAGVSDAEAQAMAEPKVDALDDFEASKDVSAEPAVQENAPAAAETDIDKFEAKPPQAEAAPLETSAEKPTAASADVTPISEAVAASLVSDDAAGQVSSAFDALEQNMRIVSGQGRTIEDVIEAMLAPMLKEWLDANLPDIVEQKVEDEVRRITRRK